MASNSGSRRSRYFTFPTAAHFVSWLVLCPDNDISGGKVLWRGARRTKNRARELFRMAAHSLYRDQNPIGNYYNGEPDEEDMEMARTLLEQIANAPTLDSYLFIHK